VAVVRLVPSRPASRPPSGALGATERAPPRHWAQRGALARRVGRPGAGRDALSTPLALPAAGRQRRPRHHGVVTESPLSGIVDRRGPPEETLAAFASWAEAAGLRLYPAQEEALLELASGAHVILSTPTGSGKSLVALGGHVQTMAAGGRAVYTAPIKALVSEKFFDLCRLLGPDRVGMLTGDASVNPGAPVVCATAEVLANMVLRRGADTPFDQVVMDEFHFYADPDRGWAWQVPLLELTRAQFLLMSATLGDVRHLAADLTRRTGRRSATVTSSTRPIPLDFAWRATPLHETIEELVASGKAPIYVVHFTQAGALGQAQALTSMSLATRAEREAIGQAIATVRFAPGFGRVLPRFLRHGIGVHHAGMLPKYRRLVERLAQDGLLKVVCGTDTLGVGINVPIRTVVFTQLSKYDGSGARLLTAREFHQIAGRAGRAGYDDAGSVVVQAPEHVIERERAKAKAGGDPRKLRHLPRATPPPGLVPWTEATFTRLVGAPPENLRSSFSVSPSMVLSVLDRPGDGARALAKLLTDNHEDRPTQRRHIRQAIAIFRSLEAAGAVERLSAPDADGRRVRVTVELQEDFALHQPLSPFVLEVLPVLDRTAESYALDVVSVVESTLENPEPILAAQLARLRAETVARLKAEGVDYEGRMEALEKLERPKPLGELLYDLYDAYRARHPWVAAHNVQPKSVARDLAERAMDFGDYVAHYGIVRSEGLLLRYLGDVYKALLRTVPDDAKTENLWELIDWLGELVRQVDSSLLDEWEQLGRPAPAGDLTAAPIEERPRPLSATPRAMRVMVRNALFRRVEMLARRAYAELGELDGERGFDATAWEKAADRYYAAHSAVEVHAAARAASLVTVVEDGREWHVRQQLVDPDGDLDWAIVARVDLDETDATGAPALSILGLEEG